MPARKTEVGEVRGCYLEDLQLSFCGDGENMTEVKEAIFREFRIWENALKRDLLS